MSVSVQHDQPDGHGRACREQQDADGDQSDHGLGGIKCDTADGETEASVRRLVVAPFPALQNEVSRGRALEQRRGVRVVVCDDESPGCGLLASCAHGLDEG